MVSVGITYSRMFRAAIRLAAKYVDPMKSLFAQVGDIKTINFKSFFVKHTTIKEQFCVVVSFYGRRIALVPGSGPS